MSIKETGSHNDNSDDEAHRCTHAGDCRCAKGDVIKSVFPRGSFLEEMKNKYLAPKAVNKDGPKDHKDDPTDKLCFLCKKWFSIFQVNQYYDYTTVGKYADVCHGCMQKTMTRVIRAKERDEEKWKLWMGEPS